MKHKIVGVTHKATIEITEHGDDDVLIAENGRIWRPTKLTVQWGDGWREPSWTLRANLVRKSDGQVSDTYADFGPYYFPGRGVPIQRFKDIAAEIANSTAQPGAEEAKGRVRAFLEARAYVTRAPRGGLDRDVIYSVGNENAEQIDLLQSDLELLAGEGEA